MKVMVLAPVFSGLRQSIFSGQWLPHGVPAVTQLFEALAAHPDCTVRYEFLTDEPSLSDRAGPFHLEEIGGGHVTYVGGGVLVRRIRLFFCSLGLLLRVMRERPNVVYAYNAAILPAGIIARLGLAPVVFRFLGLHPFHKSLSARRGGFLRWLYGAPFAKVICTRDGSGGAAYLPLLLRPDADFSVLLNGVDPIRASDAEVASFRYQVGMEGPVEGGGPVVLFVGRLEPNKGATTFVAACARALEERPGAFQAIIVGDGSEQVAVEAEIQRLQLSQSIRVTGALPHREVRLAYAASTVYVSLNLFGNLSNTNLEALSAGLCMVILRADPSSSTDVETQEIIPDDAVVRLDRENIEADLAQTLVEFADSPHLVDGYRQKARQIARTIAPWDQRVASEIDFILAASKTQDT